MYPAFMNGCRILSKFTFVDYDEQTRQMLMMLLKTNSDIIQTLGQIAIAVEKKGGISNNNNTSVKGVKESALLNPDGTGNEVDSESSEDKGPAWRLQRAKIENQIFIPNL